MNKLPLRTDEMDSDDERLADLNLTKKIVPRRQRTWTQSIKDIDIYSVKPSMVIDGQPRFTTWWGACFSVLAFLQIMYYIYYKAAQWIPNQIMIVTERKIIETPWSKHGQDILNLQEGKIELELEFQTNRNKIAFKDQL